MDLLITGATGFLGSHLAVRWLHADPTARVGCLVRAADPAEARARLRAALHRAARDAVIDPACLEGRAEAFAGDLADPAWTGKAQAWLRGPAELIHCAANLSFREADRAAVWRTNVEGTAGLLRALPSLPGLATFNYVSTAYVAGERQGVILEDRPVPPPRFNNPYEESKWIAEGMVREGCDAAGLPWRILRPSIVIAHSVTHRMSSHSGFYQVVDTLLQLGRLPGLAGGEPIRLPVMKGTTLDLIPIDAVVDEIARLIAAGGPTTGRVFHITADQPLQLAQVLRELTPMSRVAIEVNGADTPLTPVARLVMRGLRYYMPYFGFARRFDRREAQAIPGHAAYRMTLDGLRGFVRSYLEQKADAARLKDAA